MILVGFMFVVFAAQCAVDAALYLLGLTWDALVGSLAAVSPKGIFENCR